MAAGQVTVTIGGTPVTILNASFQMVDAISTVSTVMFTVRDDTGSNHFTRGMPVTITDSINGFQYSGFVSTAVEDRVSPNILIFTQIGARDNHYLAEKRTYDGPEFTNMPAGIILCALLDVLAQEGITAKYASRRDTAQTDFAAGTLTNTVATSNVGDGDIELATAGSTATKTFAVTSDWTTGATLTSIDAGVSGQTANQINLKAYSAIKFTGFNEGSLGNTYAYWEIGGYSALTIAGGDNLTYDVWVSSTSPQIMGAVDLTFTDGTTMRDFNSQGIKDQNNIPAHPNQDLTGFANDQWYHRFIDLTAVAGKQIAYATVAFEGDTGGNYTAYFRNIRHNNNGGTARYTYFDSTANVYTPASQSLGPNYLVSDNGYSQLKVSSVTVYDKTGTWQSPAISIDAAKIVRSSSVTWQSLIPTGITPATVSGSSNPAVPTGTTLTMYTSIDDTGTWQPASSGLAIPNLAAGLKVASRNIYVRAVLAIANPSPEISPIVSSVQTSVTSSWTQTKTDSLTICKTSGDFNTGNYTTSQYYTAANNSQFFTTSDNGVSLLGYWEGFDTLVGGIPNTTVWGTGSPQGYTDHRQLKQQCGGSANDSRLQFTSAPSMQNFTAQISFSFTDITRENGCGIVYRSTGWQNNNNTFAYTAMMVCNAGGGSTPSSGPTQIQLGRGTNSNSGAGTYTSILTANLPFTPTNGNTYTLKVVANGNTHQVYLDDVLWINTSDSTYNITGGVGVRFYNNSGVTYAGTFDNFGIINSVAAPQSGTWDNGTGISLGSTIGTAGNSIVAWDADIPTGATLLAQTSVDGSTWQTATSGAAIPNLGPGTNTTGKSVRIKFTLTSTYPSVTPVLKGWYIWITTQTNASGTRVAPALSLDDVGRLGGSVIAWNSNLPTGTTLGVDTSVSNVGENSYGITNGLNPGNQYPVTSRLSQQIINWAVADGHQNFRFQLDIQSMWRNQADTTGNSGGWDFSPMDDAIYKLNQAGLIISFPVRGMPTWALVNVTYQATDEPWFMPDPYYVNIACQVIASRYNGIFNIPGYGPLKLHKLEVGNEEYNIKFTSSTTAVVLNQNVNNGNNYASVAIKTSAIAVPSGVWMQFGSSGGAGDTVKLTSAINIGDIVANISATGGGTYTASSNATSGSNFTVVYRGLRTAAYSIYDGHLGVLNAGTTAQPARDPWFLNQVLNVVGPAMAASHPEMRLGAGAAWWYYDTNYTDFILGLGSAIQYVEYVNFHFYSNKNDPHVSSGHNPSITTAITNIYNALVTAGYGSTAIECTEFGWQSYTIATTATQTIAAGVRTITPVSMSGINTSIPLLIDEFGAHPETVTPSSTTGTTFTATFAQAHSGTWTIGGNGDCSEQTQANRYTSFFADVLATGKVRRVYLFTYSDSHNTGNNSSLYLWNGTSYHQQAALAVVRNQIISTPYLIPGSAGAWVDQTAQNGLAISGLTGQPLPVIDSFSAAVSTITTYVVRAFGGTLIRSANSSANYIQTSYGNGVSASWQWDTANSRVIGTGGLRSVLQYAGLSFTDGCVVADMDYADGNGASSPGVCMRMADTGHLYFLKVNDASSGFAPNTIKLFVKNGSPAPTQIGSDGIINFIRGTYHRVKLEIIGTAFNVWFDENLVIQTTDATLSAAGLAGILAGNKIRCYQLYIQPYGQSVTNYTVQTRLRLGSTDPTVTPQVLDLSIATFGNSIQAGATIAQTAYYHQYMDKNIDDLAKNSNYWWLFDKNREAFFLPTNAILSPWIASDGGVPVTGLAQGDFMDANITIEDSSDLYRNRQIIDNVLASTTINQNFKGDGVSQSWTCGNQWAGAPTITVNGVAVLNTAIGVKNVDSGKQFYYAVGDPTIIQDPSLTPYTAAYTLNFTGPGQYLTYSQADNTTEQARLKAVESVGTGIVCIVEDGTGLTKAQGDILAQARINQYSVSGRLLKATTRRYGLVPGQLLNVFLPSHNVFDTLFLIRQVTTTYTTEGSNQQGWYTIEAISGPDVGDWSKMYQRV